MSRLPTNVDIRGSSNTFGVRGSYDRVIKNQDKKVGLGTTDTTILTL